MCLRSFLRPTLVMSLIALTTACGGGGGGGTSPTPSPSLTPTPTLAPSPTPTVTATPTASPTATPATTPTATPTPTPTPTPTLTATPTPTVTPATTPSPSPTPSPTGNFSDVLDLSPVSVLNTASALPANWNKRANFMEIYVRGYQDSDGDGVGDIQGLISRLDYLQQLGITGLWLMPTTESSDNDHGYAVADYRGVESDYGSLEDFQQLLTQAHARGIGVILDYVVNHSASDNPVFRDFVRADSNDFSDWFIHSASNPGWGAWGPAWYVVANGRGGYYYAAFSYTMPDFNLRNDAVIAFHENNLRYWLNMGVDGFRFDAVGVLFENGAGSAINQAENYPFMGRLQAVINEYDNRLVVCEGPDDPAGFAATDACGKAFAFGVQGQILSTASSRSVSATLHSHLQSPIADQMPLFLSNHDHFAGWRPHAQLGGNVTNMKLAASINILATATPFTYYGEEVGIGMGPSSLSIEDWRLRTPMSWTANSTHAGFSTTTPFRPLATNSTTFNVAAQDGIAGSLLEHYRSLYQLKNAHPVLSLGDLELQSSAGADELIFLRRDGDAAVGVLINLSASAQDLRLVTGAPDSAYSVVYPAGGATGTTGDVASQGEVSLNVPAASVMALSWADSGNPIVVCNAPYRINAAEDGCELPVSEDQPDPVASAGANQLVIYYHRDDAAYEDWTLHLWNNSACNAYTSGQIAGVTWENGVPPTGEDPNYGLYWVLALQAGLEAGDCGNFIVHRGNEKGISNADQRAILDNDNIVFGVQRYGQVFEEVFLLD